jgi:hypothetical protein
MSITAVPAEPEPIWEIATLFPGKGLWTGIDPIEHFLFTTREGHCELSATAFVLFCRTQGLPARLVNGFQTGQWDDFGHGHYVVRQMEAHAWAEVHFDGAAGWIDFDPTPWSGGGGGLLSAIEKIQAYLRLRWLNYVISYTLSDQLSFADRLRERLRSLREEIGKTLRDVRQFLPRLSQRELARLLFSVAVTAAAGVCLAYFLVVRRRAARRRAETTRTRPTRRVPFFDEFLRLLERRGLKRRPAETAREFAGRVLREVGPSLGDARTLVEAFYRVRFGELELEAVDRARIDAVLAALAAPPHAPTAGSA